MFKVNSKLSKIFTFLGDFILCIVLILKKFILCLMYNIILCGAYESKSNFPRTTRCLLKCILLITLLRYN